MNYTVRWPDGSADDASLAGIRKEYKTGGVTDDCTVRRNDSQTWQTVRELLESLGDLKPLTEEDIAARASGITKRASRRYRDAYLVARTTDGIGGVVKIVGFIFGALIACGGFVAGSQGRDNASLIFGGIILGGIIAVPFYVLGVLVSAHAQVLKASLDEAVHTSPFLTDADRASVMSLQ